MIIYNVVDYAAKMDEKNNLHVVYSTDMEDLANEMAGRRSSYVVMKERI